MPWPSAVPPPTPRRLIAAITSAFTFVGLRTVTALSPKATTPIRIELGCRSAKAIAAAFAAPNRVGSRSLARMLFETSKARITVPSRCGRARLTVGRASAKQTRASAAANSVNGTWRRQPARCPAATGTSPSEASRAARFARARSTRA
jgi:hypothetical protein